MSQYRHRSNRPLDAATGIVNALALSIGFWCVVGAAGLLIRAYTADYDAMALCQVEHSYDTCASALR